MSQWNDLPRQQTARSDCFGWWRYWRRKSTKGRQEQNRQQGDLRTETWSSWVWPQKMPEMTCGENRSTLDVEFFCTLRWVWRIKTSSNASILTFGWLPRARWVSKELRVSFEICLQRLVGFKRGFVPSQPAKTCPMIQAKERRLATILRNAMVNFRTIHPFHQHPQPPVAHQLKILTSQTYPGGTSLCN